MTPNHSIERMPNRLRRSVAAQVCMRETPMSVNIN
jgi:hypothetical protein